MLSLFLPSLLLKNLVGIVCAGEKKGTWRRQPEDKVEDVAGMTADLGAVVICLFKAHDTALGIMACMVLLAVVPAKR